MKLNFRALFTPKSFYNRGNPIEKKDEKNKKNKKIISSIGQRIVVPKKQFQLVQTPARNKYNLTRHKYTKY